jgi:hypothetical protein
MCHAKYLSNSASPKTRATSVLRIHRQLTTAGRTFAVPHKYFRTTSLRYIRENPDTWNWSCQSSKFGLARLTLAGMSLLTTVSDASEDVPENRHLDKGDSVALFDDFT